MIDNNREEKKATSSFVRGKIKKKNRNKKKTEKKASVTPP